MTSSRTLHALGFAYQHHAWEANLTRLLHLLNHAAPDSFTLAPELCLTGYSYERMEEAATFSAHALETLLQATAHKSLGLTCIVRTKTGFVNRFFWLCDGRICHRQDKAKLFPLGNEPAHFEAGQDTAIMPFTCKDVRLGVLVCFELRFPYLWEQLKGVDVILVPALWGKARKGHFETLCEALAIANQCYVIASNSTDEEMAGGSAIIDPFGVVTKDDSASLLTCNALPKTLSAMRRYITIGL